MLLVVCCCKRTVIITCKASDVTSWLWGGLNWKDPLCHRHCCHTENVAASIQNPNFRMYEPALPCQMWMISNSGWNVLWTRETLKPSVPSFLPRTLQTCHGDVSKFLDLLAKPGCNFLGQEDLIPFPQIQGHHTAPWEKRDSSLGRGAGQNYWEKQKRGKGLFVAGQVGNRYFGAGQSYYDLTWGLHSIQWGF